MISKRLRVRALAEVLEEWILLKIKENEEIPRLGKMEFKIKETIKI